MDLYVATLPFGIFEISLQTFSLNMWLLISFAPQFLLMKVKAFLFDYDETTVYAHDDHVRAFVQAGKKFGVIIKRRDIMRRFGKSAINILFELLPELTDDEIFRLRDEKERIYRKIISHKKIKLVEGVVDLLKFLKEGGVKTGIVSSASVKNIVIGLRKNRIAKYFDVIVGAEDVKRHKPNPDPLLRAAKKLKVRPKDCVYIGDSIFDMISAKRAGMKRIGLTTGFYSEMRLKFEGAKYCFRNHEEVLSFLRSVRI
jgi:pyrophosphatase PpaX